MASNAIGAKLPPSASVIELVSASRRRSGFIPLGGMRLAVGAKLDDGAAASGGRMSQTASFQETLPGLAVIDGGVVEDQVGLGPALPGHWRQAQPGTRSPAW